MLSCKNNCVSPNLSTMHMEVCPLSENPYVGSIYFTLTVNIGPSGVNYLSFSCARNKEWDKPLVLAYIYPSLSSLPTLTKQNVA